MDYLTQLNPPIILIAIGGLVLITQRNGWWVLSGLLLQWSGLAWQVSVLPVGRQAVPVELVTALGCCGIFGLTFWNLQHNRSTEQYRTENVRDAIADQLWLWAITLVAGLAGFGLARLYPLGGSEQDLTAFYWIVLPALLAIVVNSSRDPVKLGAGMLSLFNAGLFLMYILSEASPGVGLLGLAALGRLALAAIASYSWLFIQASYLDLDLNALFDLRDSKIGLTKALVLVPEPSMELTGHVIGDTETGVQDTEPDDEEDEIAGDGEANEASGDA